MGVKKEKGVKKEEEQPKLSYFQIFRYATCLEQMATVLGVILGFLSGGGVTYNLVQFGELSTAFVERTTNQNISYLPLTVFFGGGKRVNTSDPTANLNELVQDGVAMAIGMFVSIGASMVLCVLGVGLTSWSALRQISRIRKMFLQAALRQDMAWFDTDSEFNLASRMAEDMMKLKEGMGEKMCVVANLVGTAALSVLTAFPLGWELTLACGSVVPFSIAASVLLTNYQTKSSIRELQAYSQAGKQAEEVLKSVKTVVAFGGEGKEVERYRKLLEPAEQYGRRRGLYSGLGNGFNWVLTYSLNAIGLVYGTRLVLADMDKPDDERRYLVGVMFSVLFSVYMATQSITLCVPHAEVFAAARGAAAGIFVLIEREPSIDSLQKGGIAPRRVIGEIVLEDVHFSYPSRPDVQVLKGFNLRISPGECVALVGSSGCGKSTILQLLQRLYDPRSGSVRLDGKDVRNLNLGWLRSCLGVVGQEPVLFRGTIHENISLGCPEATREEVQRVAEMAYAHDFIIRLPNGYDTVIGERGASLSGGQKQRIAIARSLLREPAVLLLDEATSALDSASERQVQAALDRAAADRTTLMVSHRLVSGGQKQRIAIARSLLREPAVLLLDEATSALDSASERQVQAALDRAAADRTTLMVSHRLVSGGQKQRIAIARSLLREPAVLLLDEATSALDSASERQVQAALDRAAADRTTLMVSHRLVSGGQKQRIAIARSLLREPAVLLLDEATSALDSALERQVQAALDRAAADRTTLMVSHRLVSGGQKQRIAIARSLLREPAVLLLDEATSALDSASERQVQAALDRAAADRTTLMVSHRLVSGGQKQRIAIARSLLREPAVLLLDEATSALDSASERQVQAALDRAAADRTTLMVSHRLVSGGQKQRIAIARSLLREPAVLLLDEATSALDSASERQVQAALDRAAADRTTLMVSHRLVSGGQKQRIAIARSLLREPAVLLLDEATSALDSASERQVQAALDRAAADRTTLMVSHRLSTIVNANRIICMDSGQIVEQGSHEELMKKKGFYYKLVTTTSGKEVKEPDVIETLPEEGDGDAAVEDVQLAPRVDAKRRSGRRPHRHHSIKRESHDWITPRGSIVSVMSTGLQNFVYNADIESDEEKDEDEEIKPISDLELLRLNAPEWPYMVVGSIAAFMQGTCFPVFAVLFGFTAGIYVLPDRDDIIYQADLYSGMFLLVAAVAGCSMCLQGYSFTHAGLKMTTRLRQQYFEGLLRQEIGFFDKQSNTVGAMCARLSGDAAEVQGATGLRVGLILQGFSSVFVGFVIAICYNWKLTLVGAAFLPLMVGSIWLEGIVSQKSQQNERAAMESATAIATEAIVSIRTVQSLGVEQVFLNKFNEELVQACAAVAKKTRWRGLVLGLGVYVPFLSYISATVYGTTLVATKEVEYKVVLLVNEALMYGAYMLGQSLVYAPSFNSAKDCGARILALIRRDPKIKTENGVRDKKDWAATGAFGIKDVEFCYPTRPNQRILKGVDLKAEAGKTVALVGSSGCGKSTILQLIQRFYDPETGNIELDGRDIRCSLTVPRLRRQLGVVQQEPVLFDRTLGENIAYGDNNRKVTMHEIVAAAKAANIHSFIVSLPKGYDTNLGSAGAQLSGGQKQRVCIARALIRSPRLLLLDEATSALDANSERAVTEALEKAAKGRTCITIAHRLSTIKDANLICVLDKGKIVERGNHTELLSLKGHYWRMCREQGTLQTNTSTTESADTDKKDI